MKNKFEQKINLEYSEAQQEDERGIMELLVEVGGDRSLFDIKKFVVVKDGDKIVGCVRIKELDEDCLELSSLAVSPEYQHGGIGSNLVVNLLVQEKIRPIYLLTSLDKEQFYNKFGFKIEEPKDLPNVFKKEYERIIDLPFAKNTHVIAMVINNN